MVPAGHREFAPKILTDHGVPEMPEGGEARELIGWTEATATPQVLEALKHPKVKLIANALGTPPAEIIDEIHEAGRLVAALCGSSHQALKHKAAGVDIIIAQGTEGGGHTGEIGSMVLWPEVIDAVAPTPVLAAGGIGTGGRWPRHWPWARRACGRARCGSPSRRPTSRRRQMDSYLKATSRDTVRSRSWTGKPCRMLRNDWTEAWENPENPKPLGMPLQFMVTADAVRRGHPTPSRRKAVNFNPVGQIIGNATKVRPRPRVVLGMVEECIEAQERLSKLMNG